MRGEVADGERWIEVIVVGVDRIARLQLEVEIAHGEIAEVLLEGELGVDDGHGLVDGARIELPKLLPDPGDRLGTNLLLHKVKPDVGRVHERPPGFPALLWRVQRDSRGVLE